MSKAPYRRMPWIAATGIAIIDAYTRNSTPRRAGPKVHSANATMANADGEGHDAGASAHLRLPKSAREASTARPSATAGHAWRTR